MAKAFFKYNIVLLLGQVHIRGKFQDFMSYCFLTYETGEILIPIA